MRIQLGALPPGQRPARGFPRFGTHLHKPPPVIPDDPVVAVEGGGVEPFAVPLSDLGDLPRAEISADFHCVAGWSATGLRWEGVPFAAFWSRVLEPALPPGTEITHLVLEGLDGYRAVVEIDDALVDDVMLAEHLDGRPLDGDHGAPLRFVSPSQYGFISTKHLCRVELHTRAPAEGYGAASRLSRMLMIRPLFALHRRSRVWPEERNAMLPNWFLRPIYRALTPPIRVLSRRGSDRRRSSRQVAGSAER